MSKYLFKILLVGPPSVGKTSLLYRFVEESFSLKYKLTIGCDFLSKTINLDPDINVKLQIWDIAGQDKFAFLRKSFYEGAHGALLIFDLTRLHTFEKIKNWLSELYELVSLDIPFVLIGNKLDLINQDSVLEERVAVQKYAEDCFSIYVETSAKTGTHVEQAFFILTRKLIQNATHSKAKTLI